MTTSTKIGRLTIKLHRAQKTETEIHEQAHEAFMEWRRLCILSGEATIARQEIEDELRIERAIRDYISSKP